MQVYRAARTLPDSQADYILDGGVVIDSDQGKIVAVGKWDDIKSHVIDEGSVEDLGDVTLMPGRPVSKWSWSPGCLGLSDLREDY
jgi:imidazolonepropionase-like amidohydrolase